MLREAVQSLAGLFGFRITHLAPRDRDMEPEFHEIFQDCQPYTMTSKERGYALYNAVKYIIEAGIPGDFVECGVWRGGSAMIMASTLVRMKETSRKLWLYDTFEGMTRPTDEDMEIYSHRRATELSRKEKEWCSVSLDEVKGNMSRTRFPSSNVVFVKGKVETTIPKSAPGKIALLRLDTDWYGSIQHELTHLFPRISDLGVLIIDDYGYWTGVRRAVDEYIERNGISIMLNRVDDATRLAIVHSRLNGGGRPRGKE